MAKARLKQIVKECGVSATPKKVIVDEEEKTIYKFRAKGVRAKFLRGE